MPMTCPKGHAATIIEHPSGPGTPVCEPCNLIATSYNPRLGVVYDWIDRDEHDANCERMQDQMDAAFDNQHFGDGW